MLSKRLRRAFTLIELLVVIAIIAILTAMLFPVFSQAREKSRQSVCASNMKQLMYAVNMYADEYDDCIVPYAIGDTPQTAIYWTALLQPYLRNTQVFRCPDVESDGIGMNHPDSGHWQVKTADPGWQRNALHRSELPSESGIIILADAAQVTNPKETDVTKWLTTAKGTNILRTPNNGTLYTQLPERAAARHHDMVNCMFGDSHAKAMSLHDIGFDSCVPTDTSYCPWGWKHQ